MMTPGMSAKTDEVTKKEALAADMDMFVTKPFRYKQLIEVLQSSKSFKSGKSFSVQVAAKIDENDSQKTEDDLTVKQVKAAAEAGGGGLKNGEVDTRVEQKVMATEHEDDLFTTTSPIHAEVKIKPWTTPRLSPTSERV